MSHKGIRLLIEDAAKSLGDNIQFTYARASDFNVMRDKVYPFIQCDPLQATASFTVNNVSNYMKSWNAIIAFYELDEMASDQDQYKLILDRMNDLCDRFIHVLNLYSQGAPTISDDIILTNISQGQFVKYGKGGADIVSGCVLNITITVSDQFNYCGLERDVC